MFRLSIARPCDASWGDMRPDDGGRFCGSCAKHVHDLSRVTLDVAVRHPVRKP